jgi:hypothetical protein
MFWINFYHNMVFFSESISKHVIAENVLYSLTGLQVYNYYSL